MYNSVKRTQQHLPNERICVAPRNAPRRQRIPRNPQNGRSRDLHGATPPIHKNARRQSCETRPREHEDARAQMAAFREETGVPTRRRPRSAVGNSATRGEKSKIGKNDLLKMERERKTTRVQRFVIVVAT
ncbi:hypothetical protein L596_029250 [Steinernema carpocapsae]|uniref:Uncharacterized protein n=1 Tax=Steinernema carpocapsae TaxID=34508 RepID=A0A4U5LU28_STECR|nr:hypothetical protein L596_029250 [Steinernema carpocapsae]